MRVLFTIVATLASLASAPALSAACAGFTDVDSGASYCTAVTYLKDHGITLGCTGTTYCPDAYVTRAQMALFVARAGIADPSNYTATHTDTVGGGIDNAVGGAAGDNNYNTIGGGLTNTADGGYTTVGGGDFNGARAIAATVAGGNQNLALAFYDSVLGGSLNTANGGNSTIGGGGNNATSGSYSTVPGGRANVASGSYSFAAGRNAQATTLGSFVWADSTDLAFEPSVSNFFAVRATGGVGFTVMVNPTTGVSTQFCNLLPGTPSWQCTSDRNAKEYLEVADGNAVLDRLVAMPVYSYSFKGADPSIRSLGPMAQDFFAAFGLGQDNKMVASINLEGVALAAIQGLNAKVEEKDTRIAALERAMLKLQEQIAALTR